MDFLPPGNAALHLGPLSAGDPGDVANTEPQLQPAAQLGLCHGERRPCGKTLPQQACFLAAPGCLAATQVAPGRGWHTEALSHLCLSLQVLCCVDKQGILSWPNPSPETVLFFSGKMGPPHSSHEDLTDDLSTRSFCHPEGEEEVWPVASEGQGEARGK